MMAALILCLLQMPQNVLAQESDRPPQVVADGPIQLTLAVSSRSALVAETITLRVQVDAPEKTLITLPPFGEILGPFSVLDTNTAVDLPVDSKPAARRWITTIELESLETGEQVIPRLEILYRLPETAVGDGNAREGALRSEPISIQIGSVLNDQDSPKEFRDIKAAHQLPPVGPKQSNLAWLVVGTVIAVCAAICLWIWSRRSRRPAPIRWALREIESIESQYQEKAINIGQATTQLSTVIRGFLEAQLAVPATAQSSTELISELPTDRCPESARQRLKRFMTEADELKFSGRVSLGGEQDESPFDSIRAIIRETSQYDTSQPPKDQERS